MDDIYQQYAQTVYRYLMTLTHDPELAEELTQETFYQAVRSSGKYDESCRISTWLCGIARNVLRTWQRKNPQHEDLMEQDLLSDSAETDALRSSDRVLLFRNLHELEDPFREVLYLRIFGELSFREIGEIFARTENWARVTFYRGKEKLRKEIKDE